MFLSSCFKDWVGLFNTMSCSLPSVLLVAKCLRFMQQNPKLSLYNVPD